MPAHNPGETKNDYSAHDRRARVTLRLWLLREQIVSTTNRHLAAFVQLGAGGGFQNYPDDRISPPIGSGVSFI